MNRVQPLACVVSYPENAELFILKLIAILIRLAISRFYLELELYNLCSIVELNKAS